MSVKNALRLRSLKLPLFALSLSIATGIVFHVFAASNDPTVKIIAPDDTALPDWCPLPDNPGLTSVCGIVTSNVEERDAADNLVANVPKEGVTVAVYEDDPNISTGKELGNLTRLFSSTSTNSLGRFQISVRKVGPPNVKVHLVYLCGSNIVAHKEIDSWHNYPQINEQVNCNSVASPGSMPPVPLVYVDRTKFLGCTNNASTDTPVGLAKQERPTINSTLTEENYDHRYTRNLVTVNIAGVSIPTFTSPGGLREPDCLLKNNGDEYLCNATNCAQYNNGIPQLGAMCSGKAAMQDSNDGADYLTRPFFKFISKVSSAPPYRRFDVRANTQNIITDPLAALKWSSKFIGSTAVNAAGAPAISVRQYLGDDTGKNVLPSCDNFKESNSVTSYIDDNKERNRQINGGPFTGLALPGDNLKETYYSQDISQEVCTNGGASVKLCQIQPSWGPYCTVGEPGCKDDKLSEELYAGNPAKASILANCGTDYVLSYEYFPIDKIYAANTSSGSFTGFTDQGVSNDSVTSATMSDTFNYETAANPFSTSSRAINPEDKTKENSWNKVAAAINPKEWTTNPNVQDISNPITLPYVDPTIDYLYKGSWWNYDDVGNSLTPLCTLGDMYQNPIAGPAQETDVGSLSPDNLFDVKEKQTQHITNPSAGTSTWYFSDDAIKRDAKLKLHLADLPDASGIVDALFINMGVRDIWDSMLSLGAGDPARNLLSFPFGSLITAGINISINSNNKTFASRDATLNTVTPAARSSPVYNVSYPLSEESFANGTVHIPSKAEFSWTDPIPCYPFSDVPKGEKCNTYRELPDGFSSTCKATCTSWYKTSSGSCTCVLISGTVTCAVGGTTYNVHSDDSCTDQQKYDCAYNQEGTDPPDASSIPNSDSVTADDCYAKLGQSSCPRPTDPLVPTTCSVSNPTPGTAIPGCKVEVAGPMQGGTDCNGTLKIGDPAYRMQQGSPLTGPNAKPQKELDTTTQSALVFTGSFDLPTNGNMINSKQIATLDASLTGSKAAPGMETYGQETEMQGGANPYFNLMWSTPVSYKEYNAALTELYYHCTTTGYTPSERGIQSPTPTPAAYVWECPISAPPNPEIAVVPDTAGNCTTSLSVLESSACINASSNRIPANLSANFVKVINLAAQTTNVPAAALITILAHEWTFPASYEPYWSDNYIFGKNTYPWWGRMDFGGDVCNDLVKSAQRPFSFIKGYFDVAVADGMPACDALNQISPGRCKTVSKCNFLDAAVVAGSVLSNNGGFGNCSGFNFHDAFNMYAGGSGNLSWADSVYSSCGGN